MFITLTRLWEEPRISLVTVMGCAPFHPTPPPPPPRPAGCHSPTEQGAGPTLIKNPWEIL